MTRPVRRSPLQRASMLCLALAAAVTLSGCTIGGTHWGRMAMRGPAYKRLIPTYTEAVGLQAECEARYDEEAAAGASGDRLAAIAGLRDDARQLREDAAKGLELRRRMYWNRKRIDKLWSRYERLFPNREVDLRYAYKKERMVDRDEIRMRRTPLTHEQRFSVLGFRPWDIPPEEMGIYDVLGRPTISKAPLKGKSTQWDSIIRDDE